MGFLNTVVAVLVLLLGLKVMGSVAFNSFLASPVTIDYHILPSVALFAFAVIVCVAKILSSRRRAESEERYESVMRDVNDDLERFQQQRHRRESEPKRRDQ